MLVLFNLLRIWKEQRYIPDNMVVEHVLTTMTVAAVAARVINVQVENGKNWNSVEAFCKITSETY